MNPQQAQRAVLAQALADRGVHVLGEALSLSPLTRGLAGAHPDQVHLLPAADASLAGVAAGLAMAGHPVLAELAGVEAIHGVLPQLAAEACEIHGTAQEFPQNIVFRVPVSPGQAVPFDLLATIPGLVLGWAGSAQAAAPMLRAALSHRAPVLLLDSGSAAADEAPVEKHPIGAARLLQAGGHLSLVGWGPGTHIARQAAAQLAEQGVDCDVLDLGWLAPLDVAAIGQSVTKTGRVVCVGTGDSVLAAILHGAFLRLESPPQVVEAHMASVLNAAQAALTF